MWPRSVASSSYAASVDSPRAAALPLAGCFQSSTVIRVKADGSGTIEQRTLLPRRPSTSCGRSRFSAAATRTASIPTSEAQARALAAAIGPGVTYVSSTPITSRRSQGRDVVYSFADVTQLRISEQPQPARRRNLRRQWVSRTRSPIAFAFDRKPDGNVPLRIIVPRPALFPTGPNGEPQAPLAPADHDGEAAAVPARG